MANNSNTDPNVTLAKKVKMRTEAYTDHYGYALNEIPIGYEGLAGTTIKGSLFNRKTGDQIPMERKQRQFNICNKNNRVMHILEATIQLICNPYFSTSDWHISHSEYHLKKGFLISEVSVDVRVILEDNMAMVLAAGMEMEASTMTIRY